jgi:hypothetical protein
VNSGAGEYFVAFQLEGDIQPYYSPIFGLMCDGAEAPGKITIVGRDITGAKIMGFTNTPGVLNFAGQSIPRDQWVHFEWYTHIASNGSIKAWMNGVLISDVSNVDTLG